MIPPLVASAVQEDLVNRHEMDPFREVSLTESLQVIRFLHNEGPFTPDDAFLGLIVVLRNYGQPHYAMTQFHIREYLSIDLFHSCCGGLQRWDETARTCFS